MANKRQLKSFVRSTCGAMASEILFAHAAFPSIESKAVREIVLDIAHLQSSALARIGISFDKAPRDFENRAEYRKERSQYFAVAYSKLLADFDESANQIIKKMNAALPKEVREQIKEAVAE